ncbi:hypothetical protein AM587_10012277 [Phytophthora nicotianae]|uniref:Uncharacterized protein n=1 Tax=Phytophthora nicotianae TaxID=4792 RepID=A0A0W8C6A3_PHYNI|nr:hypothetical protein AM587_10012277 [Phytophthora nicotianae]
MTQHRRILVVLVVAASLVNTFAIDWTFWNDDDGSSTPTPAKVTSPSSSGSSDLSATVSIIGTSESSSSLYLSLDEASAKALVSATSSSAAIDAYTDKLDLTIPKVTEATSSVTSEYRNWVGPRPVSPDGACYREAHIMDTCPTNFDRNEATNTCWAECPIAYPVECGMQCIRQNDDCMMDTLNKIGAIGNSALAIASVGAFLKLWQVAESVRFAFDCVNIMIGTMRSIFRYIRNIKTTDPTASTEKILNILYQSHNVVTDLPMAMYLCSGKPPPRTLDVSGRMLSTINWILLNAIGGMIEDLVSKGKSKNGSDEDGNYFMYQAFGKVLISIAVTGFDMIGVMGLIATYLQTICGPTNFMGEIDDGTDPKTLGLTMIQRAFKNSTMSWKRKGDGAVIVDFKSTDTKDVTVNIMSGGDKIDEVDVKAGGSAQWLSNVTRLAGRTLYMDRWRPGFLGLPGTGGGSLLLWVPHASEGGHLELQVKLNVS